MSFDADKQPRKAIINKALDWAGMSLSEQIKSIRFIRDEDNNALGIFAVLVDPTYTTENILARERVVVRDPVGDVNASVQTSLTAASNPDLDYLSTAGWLTTMAELCVFNPVQASIQKVRTPTHWKSVETAVAAATTDLWTPGGGKKFRVLGGTITMGGTIAAAAKRSLKLIEETAGTVIVAAGIDIPILGNNIALPFDLRPNGFLASTADKKLQVVTAGATYVTGSDWVSVWGTEE